MEARLQSTVADPTSEVFGAGGRVAPLVLHRVEALAQIWQAELCEGLRNDLWKDVRRLPSRRVTQQHLVLSKLGLWWFVFRLVGLRLVPLVRGHDAMLQLCLRRRHPFPPRLFHAPLRVDFFLLLSQDQLSNALPESFGWLADHDPGHAPEAMGTEAPEHLGPLRLQQVPPHLHHDEVQLLQRGHLVQDPSHTTVVHGSVAVHRPWLVARPVLRGRLHRR
mmetsp:Transcript_119380/g.337740  ORF Transcript_119380/g.337740 Transcript_119380/m.337740 type:complete len:220 (-) Transcript_119380:671-1330(-)